MYIEAWVFPAAIIVVTLILLGAFLAGRRVEAARVLEKTIDTASGVFYEACQFGSKDIDDYLRSSNGTPNEIKEAIAQNEEVIFSVSAFTLKDELS